MTPKNTSNYPLMGGKSFSCEAGMRVPFIVRWPAAFQGGKIEDTPVIGTDRYPAFLDAASGYQLFNLTDDPYELQDQSAAHQGSRTGTRPIKKPWSTGASSRSVWESIHEAR